MRGNAYVKPGYLSYQVVAYEEHYSYHVWGGTMRASGLLSSRQILLQYTAQTTTRTQTTKQFKQPLKQSHKQPGIQAVSRG